MPQLTSTETIETVVPPAVIGRVADDLAGALCLTAEGFQSMSTEQQKFADAYVRCMKEAFGDCQDCAIRHCIDNFAARFLPSLISAYKSWPGICSPYAAILFLLSSSPYLVRYIRKTGQGTTLLSLCAHKMVQHPIPFTKDLYRDSAVLQSLSVMSHLLSLSLSNVSRKRLLKWMNRVSARSKIYYNDDSVGGLTQTAYKLMGEVAELNAISLRNRTAEADVFYIPWLDCGSHQKHCVNDPCLDDECLHEDPLMLKNQRKQCSRCKATAYCSKEHQKLDWPLHKLFCFPTKY
ncbi:hypothetical protein B0H11DRAFT_1921197 [Mycena galericulata]|nr:hypothetical protein B0H11DRAFT_1921197 [Mycena galericulata]